MGHAGREGFQPNNSREFLARSPSEPVVTDADPLDTRPAIVYQIYATLAKASQSGKLRTGDQSGDFNAAMRGLATRVDTEGSALVTAVFESERIGDAVA